MPDSIRPLRVLALSIAFVVLLAASALTASASAATGPGGWGDLGERAGSPGVPALDGTVDVLNADMPGKLIAGGVFTAAGQAAGNTVFDDRIAIWDGTSWSPLKSGAGAATDGLNGGVRAIAVDGSKIYAGGVFTNAGGNGTADGLAVWDTSAVTPSWQPFCPSAPTTAGNVEALKIVGNTLYVGGGFQDWGAAGPGNPRDYLIACDLTTGASSAMVTTDGYASGSIQALAVDSAGDLYAGGNFGDWATVSTADYVVKYDLPSGAISGTAGGIDTTGVDSLATIGTDLYVGTDDRDVAGIPNADAVVKWDGVAWSALGSNTANTDGYFGLPISFAPDVQALATSGSTVFASGNWINANSDPLADDVASFNGTSWNTVGSNGAGDGPLNANGAGGLAVYNGNLIVGGNFTNAGGDPLADSIACYQLGATPCVTVLVTTPPITTPAVTPVVPPVVTPPKKCKKGQKLKHGKCVKKKKKK